ncbi:MAG: sulfurtransferase TusA family protein [Peptostreptococcaceae bacterium]
MEVKLTLDCSGLVCPMPIVKTNKALKNMNEGEVIEVIATDKGSVNDFKAWCETTGNEYIKLYENGEVLHHYIKKN